MLWSRYCFPNSNVCTNVTPQGLGAFSTWTTLVKAARTSLFRQALGWGKQCTPSSLGKSQGRSMHIKQRLTKYPTYMQRGGEEGRNAALSPQQPALLWWAGWSTCIVQVIPGVNTGPLGFLKRNGPASVGGCSSDAQRLSVISPRKIPSNWFQHRLHQSWGNSVMPWACHVSLPTWNTLQLNISLGKPCFSPGLS